MSDAVETYDTPALALTLTANHGGGFSWKVEVQGIDASGQRLLAYRAEGPMLAADLDPPVFPIRVRDGDREVWTEMPLAHRKDVRDAIVALLSNAVASMKSISLP